MFKCKGFTLLELIVTTSILAILSAIVIPNFTDFIIKVRVDNEITQLYRLLMTARNSAVNYGQEVTVCPLSNNNQCISDWRKDISVFIDTNKNARYEPNTESVIKIKQAAYQGDILQYGFGRKKVIFAPTGVTIGWGANGTFKYCPSKNKNLSRAIIVATSGRFYLSADMNNDGKDQLRNGQKIICRN